MEGYAAMGVVYNPWLVLLSIVMAIQGAYVSDHDRTMPIGLRADRRLFEQDIAQEMMGIEYKIWLAELIEAQQQNANKGASNNSVFVA